jgi:hypothetical protein
MVKAPGVPGTPYLIPSRSGDTRVPGTSYLIPGVVELSMVSPEFGREEPPLSLSNYEPDTLWASPAWLILSFHVKIASDMADLKILAT